MKKSLLLWTTGLATAISLAFSSCAYDPYSSSTGGYYGDGYGHGSGTFSTSTFVATGDPRWGYDPYSYCYYDYRSHRYYDPYLYGFYPAGYRPRAVHGIPHPGGWRPGTDHCPPPRTVRDVLVVNYRDRESAYRNSNFSWAQQVKPRPFVGSYYPPRNDPRASSGPRGHYRANSPDFRPSPAVRTDYRNPQVRPAWVNPQPQAPPRLQDERGRPQPDHFRPPGRPSRPPAVEYRQPTRQYRPGPSRGQPPPQPQPGPIHDSRQMKREGLRSLGDG